MFSKRKSKRMPAKPVKEASDYASAVNRIDAASIFMLILMHTL